jgi:hypothetical protein
MTVTRVNGCKLRLAKMSDSELIELSEHVAVNIDQAIAELEKITEELAKRQLFPEPVA